MMWVLIQKHENLMAATVGLAVVAWGRYCEVKVPCHKYEAAFRNCMGVHKKKYLETKQQMMGGAVRTQYLK